MLLIIRLGIFVSLLLWWVLALSLPQKSEQHNRYCDLITATTIATKIMIMPINSGFISIPSYCFDRPIRE
jgi:hypothetical protein